MMTAQAARVVIYHNDVLNIKENKSVGLLEKFSVLG
jgi:hypothetical protein